VKLAALLLLVLAACTTEPGPRLDSATPASAPHDATITLMGERLCGTSPDCLSVTSTIQLGLELPVIDAVITSYSDTSATIVIPDLAPIGATSIVLTVNNRASNALPFEIGDGFKFGK
jgi:hypothetical protein